MCSCPSPAVSACLSNNTCNARGPVCRTARHCPGNLGPQCGTVHHAPVPAPLQSSVLPSLCQGAAGTAKPEPVPGHPANEHQCDHWRRSGCPCAEVGVCSRLATGLCLSQWPALCSVSFDWSPCTPSALLCQCLRGVSVHAPHGLLLQVPGAGPESSIRTGLGQRPHRRRCGIACAHLHVFR